MRSDYEILGSLGKGGQAHTWKARQISTGELVALKELRFTDVEGWKAIELFEREAQVLQSLNHAHIPAYLDFFTEDSEQGLTLYLAQELVQGHTLHEDLKINGRWSEARCAEALESLLEVLVFLHDRVPPVIHRDIKPSNILCGEEGHLSLIDFGAVQVNEGKTMLSTVVGTPGYMPMEQMIGQASPASDLYSLGVTIAQCLTGKGPTEISLRGSRLDFRPFVEHDSAVLHVLERMTEPDLERRFPHARAALEALRQAQALPAPLDTAPVPGMALDIELIDRLVYDGETLDPQQPFPALASPRSFWGTMGEGYVIERPAEPPLLHPSLQKAQAKGFSFVGRQTRFEMPFVTHREAWVSPDGALYLVCSTDSNGEEIEIFSCLNDGRSLCQGKDLEEENTSLKQGTLRLLGDFDVDCARHRQAMQARMEQSGAQPFRHLDMTSLMAWMDHAWLGLPEPEDEEDSEGGNLWDILLAVFLSPFIFLVFLIVAVFNFPGYVLKWKAMQRQLAQETQARHTLPETTSSESKAQAQVHEAQRHK